MIESLRGDAARADGMALVSSPSSTLVPAGAGTGTSIVINVGTASVEPVRPVRLGAPSDEPRSPAPQPAIPTKWTPEPPAKNTFPLGQVLHRAGRLGDRRWHRLVLAGKTKLMGRRRRSITDQANCPNGPSVGIGAGRSYFVVISCIRPVALLSKKALHRVEHRERLLPVGAVRPILADGGGHVGQADRAAVAGGEQRLDLLETLFHPTWRGNTLSSKALGSPTFSVPCFAPDDDGRLGLAGGVGGGETGGQRAGAAVGELDRAGDVVGRGRGDFGALLRAAADHAVGDGDGGHAADALDRPEQFAAAR